MSAILDGVTGFGGGRNRMVQDINPVLMTFPAGRKIFSEGDTGEEIYIVEAGEVEISRVRDGGKVVLNVVGSGAVFGEMALLQQTTRMATATALQKTSVYVVPKYVLDRQMEGADAFIRKLVLGLIHNLKAADDLLVRSQGKTRA